MKQILVMMAVVVLVGCSKDTPETSQAAEAEIQIVAKFPVPPSQVTESQIQFLRVDEKKPGRFVRNSIS